MCSLPAVTYIYLVYLTFVYFWVQKIFLFSFLQVYKNLVMYSKNHTKGIT